MQQLFKMKQSLILTALSLVFGTACGRAPVPPGPAAETRASVEAPDDKIDYDEAYWGEDHRLDLFAPGLSATDREEATGVAAIVDASAIRDNGDGWSDLQTRRFDSQFPQPLCPGERFGDQPVIPACSGFLVADDILATANHCVWEVYLPEKRIVFGFQMDSPTVARTRVSNDAQVYRLIATIASKYDAQTGSDFALVRLDRPVRNRHIFPLRQAGTVASDSFFHVLGHPMGLPMKFTGPSRVLSNTHPAYIVTDADTYNGNSGSPLINRSTREVEGIVVRGEGRDMELHDGCWSSRNCTPLTCWGTHATRSTEFNRFIWTVAHPKLAAGAEHMCVLLENGTAKCWGNNQFGQLGDGTLRQRLVPTPVRDQYGEIMTGMVELHAVFYSTCARFETGQIRCWGLMGDSRYGEYDPRPRTVLTQTQSFRMFVVSRSFGFGIKAIRSDGMLVSYDSWRQTSLVETEHTFTEMVDSWYIDWCARLQDNSLSCLAEGEATYDAPIVALIYTGSPTTSVYLLASGRIISEGREWTIPDVVSIMPGLSWDPYFVPYVVYSDGTVSEPIYDVYLHTRIVPGVTQAKQIIGLDPGINSHCVWLNNSTGQCWGYNNFGQLGDGTTTNRPNPVTIHW